MPKHAKHLELSIHKLKQMILTLSSMVEISVQKAVTSVEERDAVTAQRIIDADSQIDQMEVDLEEECLKILALYQPVANDLRFIVSLLKINNDLERIADLAVNIAERSKFLSSHDRIDIPVTFQEMSLKARLMLKKSLDSLVNMDDHLAREVCMADDEVDACHREMFGHVKAGILRTPSQIDCWIQLLSAARNLERIADLATNIAEDVLYMVDGVIIRHKTE